MTNCGCNINQGFFQGDDLVDVITVNRPQNSQDLTIIKAELQVGSLTFVEDDPVFPYTVSIMRNQSILLLPNNPVYLRISFLAQDGTTSYRRTCLGSLDLMCNKQVVRDTQ